MKAEMLISEDTDITDDECKPNQTKKKLKKSVERVERREPAKRGRWIR
jgi:hypothetical protein